MRTPAIVRCIAQAARPTDDREWPNKERNQMTIILEAGHCSTVSIFSYFSFFIFGRAED